MYRRGIVNLVVRLSAAVLGCTLVLALSGCGGPAGSGALAKAPAAPGPSYTLLQMNLCLSGLGSCDHHGAYPAVVEEAAARIRDTRPDAVTVNEACEGDVRQIARRTGYHMRFSRVVYLGKLLPCVRPGGRGLFGDAVLTKAAVANAENHAFESQSGIEQRRWLCVTTRAGIDVCTSHLNTRSREDAPGNNGQCAELEDILARRAARRALIFGGDVNRRGSCAPDGLWTRTDRAADQAAGIQQVYGSPALRPRAATVLPARHTDHDYLLVRSGLARRR